MTGGSSTKISKVMTAAEARSLYDSLGLDGWRSDSSWGTFKALEAILERELVARLQRERRREEGKSARQDGTLPSWVHEAMKQFVLPALVLDAVSEQAPAHGLVSALGKPATLMMIAELVLNDSVKETHHVLATHSAETAAFLSRVPSWLKEHRSHAKAEIEAFYRGTRMYWYVMGRPEPTTTELALLVCAREIEAEPWGAAIKHWGERVGRWSKRMDEALPTWRSAMKSAREGRRAATG